MVIISDNLTRALVKLNESNNIIITRFKLSA
jgi:hypothetical protein